jgi:hypothetical protein
MMTAKKPAVENFKFINSLKLEINYKFSVSGLLALITSISQTVPLLPNSFISFNFNFNIRLRV